MIVLSKPPYNIVLSNPELGDNIVLNSKVTFYKTMDGQTISYKKLPNKRKHRLLFKYLTRRKALELVAFCKNVAGMQIIYTDKGNVSWVGYILNEEIIVIPTGRGRINSYADPEEKNEVLLNFEGVQA